MLLSLAYVFLCGMVLAWVFRKLHMPNLLGMLVTGFVLGHLSMR